MTASTVAAIVALSVALSAACEEVPTALEQNSGTLSIVIPIENRLFEQDATLEVEIWNSEDLEALQNNEKCATVFDAATGTQQIRCPEGVEYRAVEPEKHRFPLRGIDSRVEVKTDAIRIGERFRLSASAPSQDGCNRTSATVLTTAQRDVLVLDDLSWETTLRACGL